MAREGAAKTFFSMGLPTPQPVVTRPLLGLDLHDSSLRAPDGAFVDARNVIVTPRGLYRIPAYVSFIEGATWSPSDSACLLMAGWGSGGTQMPYLLTENYVFLCDWILGYIRQEWTYSEGTIDVSATAVVSVSGSPLWLTLGIQAGDTITIDSVVYTIASVASDIHLTLTTSAGVHSGVAYSISRKLHAGDPYTVDAVMGRDLTTGNFMAVTNYRSQILKIDLETDTLANLTPTAAKQPATGGFTAECVAFFAGRTFAGHLNDGTSEEQRTLIRWSKTTDAGDFSDPTAYQYLMAQSSGFAGAIRRMLPMGSLLMVYLDDAVFAGSPSNTPNLPLAFQQVPTGNVGIAGPRAVASVVLPRTEANVWGVNISGHFFVGYDNVYFISSSNLSLEPIGDRVVRDSVLKCQVPARIQAAVDWTRRRIRFGFPVDEAYIDKIFDFNWQTKEWSCEVRRTWMLGDPFLSLPLVTAFMSTVVDESMTTTTSDYMVGPWSDMPLTFRGLYAESEGAIWVVVDDTAVLNPDGTGNYVTLETKDYDEGYPGMLKFWRMLRLKIEWDEDVAPVSAIVFAVSVSVDRGTSWRSLGNMTIAVGSDEGKINFRATGPHIRFKLTSTSAVRPYYITEMSRMVALRAAQQSGIQQGVLS